jgi:hypothetical protein
VHSTNHLAAERLIPKNLEKACYEVFQSIAIKILDFCFEYANMYKVENADMSDPSSIFVVAHNNNFYAVNQLAAIIKRVTNGLTETQLLDRAKQFVQNGVFNIPCHSVQAVHNTITILDAVGIHSVISSAAHMEKENQLLQIIRWVSLMSETNDDICEIIGECFDNKSLCSIIQHHPRLSSKMQSALNDLFVSVMSNKKFKTQVSVAYSIVFKDIAKLYSQSHGCADTSVFSISVQFLNRENLVSNMCLNYKFMKHIWDAFLDMMSRMDGITDPEMLIMTFSITEDTCPSHLTSRCASQYVSSCSSLKFRCLQIICTCPAIGRYFCSRELGTMLLIFSKLQFLHSQIRQVHQHVEFESRTW